MCATKHAPRDPFRVLERRHALAEIVECGAIVREDRLGGGWRGGGGGRGGGRRRVLGPSTPSRPVWKSTSELGHSRVNGVERPKFDLHTGHDTVGAVAHQR